MNRPSLEAGTRLGTYEVRDLIGAGGMGEVYRARDTRLDRDVAIKILPEAFAADPERLARFDREAKMLAALNHPNIASIHGIEDAGTTRALVMELVEGPTLADRIARGAIPIDETLPIARQIAEAVEAAHEQGIVHRDLKPANIKVRDDGTVKVLDFGLAKLAEGGRSASGLPEGGPHMTASPTITSPALMTGVGMLLGTAAYMSPEQARGKPVDKRSDVWAFGCVLYEMLTGKRAFAGDDVGETLAAVIKEPPAWSALPRDTPQPIRLLLNGCLEKDARARIGSISAASFLLRQPMTERQAPARHGRALALGALAGAAALTAVVLIWVALREPQPAPKPTWYTLASNLGPQARGLPGSVVPEMAAAPDGSWVVYVGPGTGGQTGPLILKRSDQLEGQPLPGTGGARRPFASPDGQWIGFFQEDGIKKIRAEGGSVQSIAPWTITGGTLGAVWTDDGTIFFAGSNIRSGIYRVMHTGGQPEPVTQVKPTALEGAHASPHLLPNGRVLLFTNAGTRSGTVNIAAIDLQTMQQKSIVSDGARPAYVSSGHLLYVNLQGTLMAVRFDADRVQTIGEPVALVEGIGLSGRVPQYDVTRTGSLLYATGAVPRRAERTLVWVDRSGRQEPVAGASPRGYTYPRVSPDGRLIAVETRDQREDIWILDIARSNLQQMTNDPGQDAQPTWLWDSRRVVFSSTRDGPPNLYVQSWDGTGAATRLTRSDNPQYPQAVGSENGSLIFLEQRPGSNDLGFVRLREDGAATSGDARMLFDGPYNENTATVSFDNRLIAYTSNETGTNEVYARTFPALANRIKVSTSGGTRPVFSRDGRELFYAEQGGRIMAVAVSPDGSFGTPQKLFDWPTIAIPGFGRTFDVTPDGKRFLMIKEADEAQAGSSDINIVVNWIEELKQRLPAN